LRGAGQQPRPAAGTPHGVDTRELVMPRFTEPDAQQWLILEKLILKLPKQPPPKIRSGEVIKRPDKST